MSTIFDPVVIAEMRDRLVREVMGQREEITKAFLAKYGFGPEEAIQVHTHEGAWLVRKMTPDEKDMVGKSFLHERIAKLRAEVTQETERAFKEGIEAVQLHQDMACGLDQTPDELWLASESFQRVQTHQK